MKKVFTNGCFDLFHIGHLNLLMICRQLAGPRGEVIVGLNSDRSVQKIKGNNRPIIPEDERHIILKSLIFVDRVIMFDQATPYLLIKEVKPDILVKGEDWKGKNVIGSNLVNKIEYAPTIKSTTEIIKKCSLSLIAETVKEAEKSCG